MVTHFHNVTLDFSDPTSGNRPDYLQAVVVEALKELDYHGLFFSLNGPVAATVRFAQINVAAATPLDAFITLHNRLSQAGTAYYSTYTMENGTIPFRVVLLAEKAGIHIN